MNGEEIIERSVIIHLSQWFDYTCEFGNVFRQVLRDDILKHGWGRPDEWVFDGASYFGAEVTAGITAWAALTRVSAPHHAESHGIIERHNQSYLDILKCFGNEKNWREHYASAFESYNRSISAPISSSTTKLAPIEVWRPGYTVTPYKIPTVRDANP